MEKIILLCSKVDFLQLLTESFSNVQQNPYQMISHLPYQFVVRHYHLTQLIAFPPFTNMLKSNGFTRQRKLVYS